MNIFYVLVIVLIISIIAYLLGSINSAIIFTKIYTQSDVRDVGSGNAGMSNAIRAAGKKVGILTLAGDLLKSVISVLMGMYIATPIIENVSGTTVNPMYMGFICGLACLIGHLYPIFFQFKGGKGVVTCLGMMIIIDWHVGLICLGIFIICFLLTKIMSLSSMIGALAFPFVTYFMYPYARFTSNLEVDPNLFGISLRIFEVIVASIFSVIIIIKHKDNIKRLIKGQEKKLALFNKK